MPTDLNQLDEKSLETWDGFAPRFSRVADMYLTKYVRTFVLINDPGYQGSLRDFVNQGEKLNIIDDAEAWMGIRELRNINAHEYNDEDMALYLERLRTECPRLLAIKSILTQD